MNPVGHTTSPLADDIATAPSGPVNNIIQIISYISAFRNSGLVHVGVALFLFLKTIIIIIIIIIFIIIIIIITIIY